MALHITLGQYYGQDSPIHRLDPRLKLASTLAIMISVFFIRTPLQLALGLAFMVVLIMLSRVPLRKVVEALRTLVFLLLFFGLFNLFFTRSGDVLFSAGPLMITSDGVRAAFLYSLRLLIGVIAAVVMLLTTTPTQLSDAFESILSPAAKLGLPAHELAMVFSLMLRFIPTLVDEAQAVIDAQTARGGALAEGSPIKRIRAVGPILVSLLASSTHHASGLSRALDARCYEAGSARSHWHPLRFCANDALAAIILVFFVAVLIMLR